MRVRIVLSADDDRRYTLAVARVLQWDRVNQRVLLQVEPESVRAPEGTVLPARWWYRQRDGTWDVDGGRLPARLVRLR